MFCEFINLAQPIANSNFHFTLQICINKSLGQSLKLAFSTLVNMGVERRGFFVGRIEI
jgi:hypothetical protein